MTETEQVRFSGYFTSDTIFSLSRKLLCKAEVKVLDIAPIQNKINQLELWRHFGQH